MALIQTSQTVGKPVPLSQEGERDHFCRLVMSIHRLSPYLKLLIVYPEYDSVISKY